MPETLPEKNHQIPGYFNRVPRVTLAYFSKVSFTGIRSENKIYLSKTALTAFSD